MRPLAYCYSGRTVSAPVAEAIVDVDRRPDPVRDARVANVVGRDVVVTRDDLMTGPELPGGGRMGPGGATPPEPRG